MSKSVKVACPQCQKKAAWDIKNPYRPFCSERCKLIDLGAWASESYQIPSSPSEEEYGEYSTGLDANEKPFTPTMH